MRHSGSSIPESCVEDERGRLISFLLEDDVSISVSDSIF